METANGQSVACVDSNQKVPLIENNHFPGERDKRITSDPKQTFKLNLVKFGIRIPDPLRLLLLLLVLMLVLLFVLFRTVLISVTFPVCEQV